MKKIFINIKNMTSYLVLIAIYFFFINIEARKDQYESKSKKQDIISKEYNNTIINDDSIKYSIPIIPFNE